MKNADSRLARVEKHVDGRKHVTAWDYQADPAYAALSEEGRGEIDVIAEKMLPFMPDRVEEALKSLSTDELERLELFIASSQFGRDED